MNNLPTSERANRKLFRLQFNPQVKFADRQEWPLVGTMSFRLLYTTERLCTGMPVDTYEKPITICVSWQARWKPERPLR